MPTITPPFTSVYGPVQSWRFGRSLGIDPIGPLSTCSFNCVYCQLGEIEHQSDHRQLFIPTFKIQQDLRALPAYQIDAGQIDTVTLSGSGEPTLAQNLGEILALAKQMLHRPVGVLTNGSLLHNPTVCAELALADWVAVKLDAVSADGLRRVNRPVASCSLSQLWEGLRQFRQRYSGHLAIQTMLLADWSASDQAEYSQQMQVLRPDEIQLNTPTRPCPLTHQLEARGNHLPNPAYPTRRLKPVQPELLQDWANQLERQLGIPVRHSGSISLTQPNYST